MTECLYLFFIPRSLNIHIICRLLFKLAVEENLMGNLVAAGMDVALDTLRKTRVRCVKEVRETNGEIDMDDALAYQKGV